MDRLGEDRRVHQVLLGVVTEHGLQLRAHVGEGVVSDIADVGDGGELLDKGPVLSLGLPEPPLGPPLLRHVLQCTYRPERPARLVALHRAPVEHDAHLAVGPHDAVLHAGGRGPVGGVRRVLLERAPIVGVYELQETLHGRGKALRGQAEDAENFVGPPLLVVSRVELPATDAGYALGRRQVPLAAPQPLLGLPAGGNVPGRAEHEAAGARLEQAYAYLDGEGAPVLAPVRPVQGDVLPGLHVLPQPPEFPRVEVFLHVRHRHAKQLVPRVPQALAGPPVDVDQIALEVVDEERVGRLFDDVAEPLLAAAQLLLGHLSLGHVAGYRRGADGDAPRVPYGGYRDRDVHPPAVLGHAHGLPAIHALAPPHPLEGHRHLPEAVRRRQHGDGLPHDLFGGVPVEGLGAPVPRGDRAVEVRGVDGVVRGLHDRRQPAEFLLGPLRLGHVVHHALPVEGAARIVAHQHRLVAQPHQPAVFGEVAVLHAKGLARLLRARPRPAPSPCLRGGRARRRARGR